MQAADLAYYQRRHAQEVRLASEAVSPEAAAAHQALAAIYAEALRRLQPRDRRLSVVPSHDAPPRRAAG